MLENGIMAQIGSYYELRRNYPSFAEFVMHAVESKTGEDVKKEKMYCNLIVQLSQRF